jgi:hypothetical protein
MALSLGVMVGGAAADNNDLFVEQVGNKNFGGSSVGLPGGGTASNNQIYVQTEGDQNSGAAGFADPSASGNQGLVSQEGNKNLATFGTFNRGELQQTGNTIGFVQDGNRNKAQVLIGDTIGGGIGNIDNTIYARQIGDGNVFGEEPSSSITFGPGNGPFAASVTVTNPNVADLVGPDEFASPVGPNRIEGVNQQVAVVQDGDRNQFGVSMTGSDNVIKGSSSATFSDGTAPGYTLNDDANSAKDFFDSPQTISSVAVQQGTANVGVVRVDGIGNNVDFRQFGNNNVNEVYQQGNNNNAFAYQQ